MGKQYSYDTLMSKFIWYVTTLVEEFADCTIHSKILDPVGLCDCDCQGGVQT